MDDRFLDPYRLIEAKLGELWNAFFAQLPNLVGAALFLLLAWGATRVARKWIAALALRRGRDDLGGLFGSVLAMVMMTVAFLIASAIVFPSVSPSTILSTLGIGSVAIGFAFRDILQNLFAGILIVINRPFRRGDVIVVAGNEGTVERVEARATIIRTGDGRRIAMPNSLIYTSPVTINTANSARRDEIALVIAPDQDVEGVCIGIEQVLSRIDGVLANPRPQLFRQTVAADGLHTLVRWWTPARGVSRQAIHSQVVGAIARVVAERNIQLAAAAPTEVSQPVS